MSFAWDIGVCRHATYDADGFIGIQYDAEGEQQSSVVPYEMHSPGGLLHLPVDPGVDGNGNPIPAQAAQVLYAMEGGKGHIWGLDDPRDIAILPKLQYGETLVYGSAGNFARMHADGSISLYTTDQGGNPNGNTIALRVTPTGLTFQAPWGTLKFDATGFHVLTKSGARMDIGAVSGAPGPLSALSSYAALQADSITLDASLVSAGPEGGESEPAAGATTLLSALSSMASAIQAMQTALAAGGAGASGPVTLPGAVASQVAVAAMQTAMATLPTQLPRAIAST